ncbi:MAG TPA: hypothetical protein VG474_11330 [Solirubrobacteraceae bacterium]|nr:hypothetical protein [Solirubrobacteraceae bacterium]
MATLTQPRRRERPPVRALPAGTLLPISRLGADGTIVLEDGSFRHIIACYPRNLQTLTADERIATFLNFRNVAAFLERGQSLQLIVEGDRVKTETHMALIDEQTELVCGFRPSSVSAAAALKLSDVQRTRWGTYQMLLESVRRGASQDGFTPRQRVYLCAGYRPEDDSERSWRDALPAGLPGSRMTRRGAGYRRPRRATGRRLRDHQQLARVAEMRARELIGHLERDGITARILDGPAVLRYASSRLNPTSVSWDRSETLQAQETVLSRFDDSVEGEDAERAALGLRDMIARSPLDFRRYSDHAEIEQDLVHVLFLAGSPSMTQTFWLAELMHQPLPYTLTVHLHGLDRLAIAEEAKRLHHQALREIEREAKKGRSNAQTTAQADAHGALATQMARDPKANLIDMSVYLALRAPGPRPDKHALAAAAYDAQRIVTRATGGGTLDRGNRLQEPLWLSTLPFGANLAARTLRVGVEHAADTFPLIGSTCGSPSGIPLFTDPVSGQLQHIHPFDRALQNSTIVIAGRSGVGKTVTANRLVCQMVALGARGYLFDRAGHYELLAELIPGARVIRMGADDGHVINHWDTPDPYSVPSAKVKFLLRLHETLLRRELTNHERKALADCIRTTYSHCARTGKVPREGELVGLMRASAEHEAGCGALVEMAQVLRGLIAELSEFVGGGTHAAMWDRETTLPAEAPLLIFDYRNVDEQMLIALVFANMEWTRREVQRVDRQARSTPIAGSVYYGRSIVGLDEGWAWAQVPVLAGEVQTWARQGRAYGAAFMVVSQDPEDFDGDADAVLRNASIRIFHQLDKGMLAFVRDTVDLSPEMTESLKSLRKVAGLYSEALLMNGPRGDGRVCSVLGAHEYWAWTSEPRSDVPRRERAIADNDGDVWAALAQLADEGIPRAEEGVGQ